MKKLVILMLVLSMLVSVLAACGDKKDPGPTEPTSTAGTPGGDATPPAGETQPPKTYADVPKADLGDGGNPLKVNVLVRDPNGGSLWNTIDWDYEEEPDKNTDVISSAVYNRNLRVETDYNIQITQIGVANGVLRSTAETAALQDSAIYDLVVLTFIDQLGMAVSGYIRDFTEISTVDLNDPWWNQSTNDTLALFDHYFTLCGDINIIDDMATWCVMFNKYQVDQYELGDQFGLVKNNEWTWEKMYENAAVFAEEDHKTYGEGYYGIATEYDMIYAYFATTGLETVTRNENSLSDDTASRKFETAMASIHAKLADEDIQVFGAYTLKPDSYKAVDYGALYNIFKANNALYLVGTASNVMSTQLADMEKDIGILPFPKYDTEEENYISTVQSHNATGVSILANMTSEKAETLGTVLTAMSAASVTTLTPAFYQKLLKLDIVDPQSESMMKMILENRMVDIGIAVSANIRNFLIQNVRENNAEYAFSSLRQNWWSRIKEDLDVINELGQNGFKAPEKAE